MNLRVYRNLYWANQGLIYAAGAIEDLSREQGLPKMKLQQFQAMIEETRASMNSLLSGIDQHETERAPRLEVIRFSREKAGTPPEPQKNGSANRRKN